MRSSRDIDETRTGEVGARGLPPAFRVILLLPALFRRVRSPKEPVHLLYLPRALSAPRRRPWEESPLAAYVGA
jgi:hypothetical protein